MGEIREHDNVKLVFLSDKAGTEATWHIAIRAPEVLRLQRTKERPPFKEYMDGVRQDVYKH